MIRQSCEWGQAVTAAGAGSSWGNQLTDILEYLDTGMQHVDVRSVRLYVCRCAVDAHLMIYNVPLCPLS